MTDVDGHGSVFCRIRHIYGHARVPYECSGVEARFLGQLGLAFVMMVRPLFFCFPAYDRFEMPHITPWLPVHMFLYTIILDFWYYITHRAMYEVDVRHEFFLFIILARVLSTQFLWRFPKTHHKKKHPSSLLASFSDHEEEVLYFVAVPMLTYTTYLVDFFTLWITSVCILYLEVVEHSGVHVYQQQPITGPILRFFGMDLIDEDHDLHHRNGWAKSSNYGKQTRVWDEVFGTMQPRQEMVDENVDW
ncbi:hypothetical protein BS47DRAFT_1389631 [Hydnum rufescens UP504]|uniref:Fatty acid hydroxylase domain-containing protein n=1 Tax=Hydnum rufescens UP504 TaxID=1448309 RepID=A0A9P6B7F2_9AGAM|nr:hypothetical protein BS47DRAFT_1389631 [Hydnum rufescens UP504]